MSTRKYEEPGLLISVIIATPAPQELERFAKNLAQKQ